MSSPAPSREKMVAQLRASFPKEFFEAVVAVLRKAYDDSTRSERAKLSRTRLRVVVGVSRWAYVEEEVLKLAAIFKVRDISILEVKGEGGAIHVEIRSGRFVLTLACVQQPDKFVRFSKYREHLAAEHQLALFPNPLQEPTGAEYYGILIHGPLETSAGYDHSRPGFLKVAFPNQDFNGYATDHVDVLSLYNITLAPAVADNTERIPDQARPRLKPGTPKGPKT